MKKIPSGHIINNPYDLINTNFILSEEISDILSISKNKIFFTRLSLKHLSEKHDGKYILKKMKEILLSPDRIHIGNFSNRFLVSKMIYFEDKHKAHVVTLEITESKNNIIVTGFISKESYFKNLRLLWGTASPHLNNS